MYHCSRIEVVTMYHLLWDLTVGRLWVLSVESIKGSVSSAQFCCEAKTVIKMSIFLIQLFNRFFLITVSPYNSQHVILVLCVFSRV